MCASIRMRRHPGRWASLRSGASVILGAVVGIVWGVPTCAAATTSRVSVSSSGAQALGESLDPAVSQDGRFVAFVSGAGNLVAGDTNGVRDVFVRDRKNKTTERVSISTSGKQGSGDSGGGISYSRSVAISANGRYVAFLSHAPDLVANDTNGVADVFVRDRQQRTTRRVSVSSTGAQVLNHSGLAGVAVSADGRYVAFESHAAGLVGDDTNGFDDIFVHDRQSGETRRVSLGRGGAQVRGASFFPALSADARYVAFASEAPDVVSGDTNGTTDVFVHDRQSGVTARASVGPGGVQGSMPSGRYGVAISADGRFAAFAADAPQLVSGDTNSTTDVFVRDRVGGRTERVSVGTGMVQANSWSFQPSISRDGRFVAFGSWASSLVSPDDNGVPDVFLRDRTAGTTARVSVTSAGGEARGHSGQVGIGISADGRFVAFQSYATNLVSGDTNVRGDVFLRGP